MEYLVKKISIPDWNEAERLELRHTGWLSPVPVRTWAQLCWDGEDVFVRMEAEESPVVATLTGKLDAVSDDSCVEFFFAPVPADERYFNFEFNPLGTLCLGFGGKRPDRVRQIVKNPEELFRAECFVLESGWGVTWRIPGAFIRRYFPDFRFGGICQGNFFKCGEKTPHPHYLSWMPTTSKQPDFHRRSEFGTLIFEEGERA